MNDYLKTTDIRGLDKFGFDVSTIYVLFDEMTKIVKWIIRVC